MDHADRATIDGVPAVGVADAPALASGITRPATAGHGAGPPARGLRGRSPSATPSWRTPRSRSGSAPGDGDHLVATSPRRARAHARAERRVGAPAGRPGIDGGPARARAVLRLGLVRHPGHRRRGGRTYHHVGRRIAPAPGSNLLVSNGLVHDEVVRRPHGREDTLMRSRTRTGARRRRSVCLFALTSRSRRRAQTPPRPPRAADDVTPARRRRSPTSTPTTSSPSAPAATTRSPPREYDMLQKFSSTT